MPRRPDDTALLDAWRAGDEEAGNRLVRKHFDTLVRFLERRLPPETADEVLGQTFEACVSGRERIPDGVAFRAYLLGIAWNRVKMHLRSANAQRGVQPLVEDPQDASARRVSSLVAAREEEMLLLDAVRCLEPELQVAVELYYWEEMDTAGIAAVLAVPRGTVKSRLARARTRLREHIETGSSSRELATRTLDVLDRRVAATRRRHC